MSRTEAELKAQRKYRQSEKGRQVLKKSRQKYSNTDEYRAYQREKQREYRRRRKLEATGSGAELSNSQATKVEETNLVPLVLYARIGVEPEVEAEVKTALRSLPNRSEFIRDAVIKALREEGLLPDDQDNDSRGAA